MKIISSITEMQNVSRDLHAADKKIGLVPTMGALHEGHLSLLHIARQHCDISIMSIFVNPAQFGPSEDFAQYPRPFELDRKKAEEQGCDILFIPDAKDVYPDTYMTYVTVENITEKLEGASRPGHFKGVTTIVLKLFSMVMPDIAVVGRKDAQQAVVIRRMVTDLNLPIELIIAPTVREKDGFAISSRNTYLTDEERADVPSMYKGLCIAEQEYNRGEAAAGNLIRHIQDIYNKSKLFKTEYIAIVDTETLDPVETITGKTLIAVACRTTRSNTRLIDNIVLGGTL